VAGCPLRPEALLDALIKWQAKVRREPVLRTLKQLGPALPTRPPVLQAGLQP